MIGYWVNGHYRRWKFFEGYGWAKVDFNAFIVADIDERPTLWQRFVMALQGWYWHDGPAPVPGDSNRDGMKVDSAR